MRIKYSATNFILLIRKMIYVTVIDFISLLLCYVGIDVCCTYRLRIANLFRPFWPVTENIFNFKQISSLGRATFYRRKKISEGPCRMNGWTRVFSTRIRVAVLRYRKRDRAKMHLVCGVSDVTSPFSLVGLLGFQEMAAVDPWTCGHYVLSKRREPINYPVTRHPILEERIPHPHRCNNQTRREKYV